MSLCTSSCRLERQPRIRDERLSMTQKTPIFVFLALAWLGRADAQTTSQPIPPGFDFPANEQTLLQYRDQKDVPQMRSHVWKVFAGMTQPTATGEAIWETWYSSDETFGAAQPQALTARRPQRRFRAPRQF